MANPFGSSPNPLSVHQGLWLAEGVHQANGHKNCSRHRPSSKEAPYQMRQLVQWSRLNWNYTKACQRERVVGASRPAVDSDGWYSEPPLAACRSGGRPGEEARGQWCLVLGPSCPIRLAMLIRLSPGSGSTVLDQRPSLLGLGHKPLLQSTS